MKLPDIAAKLGLTHAETIVAVAIHMGTPGRFVHDNIWDEAETRQWVACCLKHHPNFQRELTTAEAAALCGCGKSSIKRWHRQGEINPVRVQRRPELAGRHGGSPAYYWKHGEVAGLAIKHGVYKPPKKGAADG